MVKGQATSEPNGTLPIAETPPLSDSNGSSMNAKSNTSNWKSLVTYMRKEITLEQADIPIIACCIVSGLCDSSAYNAWTCFVSMQTGRYPLVETPHSTNTCTR